MAINKEMQEAIDKCVIKSFVDENCYRTVIDPIAVQLMLTTLASNQEYILTKMKELQGEKV